MHKLVPYKTCYEIFFFHIQENTIIAFEKKNGNFVYFVRTTKERPLIIVLKLNDCFIFRKQKYQFLPGKLNFCHKNSSTNLKANKSPSKPNFEKIERV